MTSILSRGIRNNNPGNVDYHPSSDPWLGLANPPTDGRFCVFDTPEHGIRVMAKLLLAYQTFHDCKSIRDIIDRWAPPVENDTSDYIDHVAHMVGVSPDSLIDAHRPSVMTELVRAIITHENGEQPYTTAQIEAGIGMALS
jgi:hypothetical protein